MKLKAVLAFFAAIMAVAAIPVKVAPESDALAVREDKVDVAARDLTKTKTKAKAKAKKVRKAKKRDDDSDDSDSDSDSDSDGDSDGD
ncbi:hypothetical protein B0T26DRAFT_750702 [Lasiosphaeria miniovina]|uniref:Uncharacterized protein n=1 Tax=Lasiosphaeria miniovina TaxID=1954250 RepID=A0AA40AWS6_9PEZI|nr:uncharacterized protein B0T26DRAFT_750702 [Lasiosphaeria miniovina]KAK0723429.1 hypothetical protein B0T26DRAFT_750702 [Lasiosphaeria miniovina]